MTQVDTSLTRTAVTDETGSYTLTSLPVGPYRLEATLPGFRTYVQTGIVLQVSSNPLLNIVLEVGQVSDTVEVQADAALVETRSTGIAQLLDNQRVLELPLNGRQVTELVLLSGVATVTSNGTLNPGSRNYPTVVITVAGGMENGLTYLLDGGTHNDPYNNLNLPMPFPDALQEFKVETSGLQAQYGHHSSGAVNAVTKSGTNNFHGSVFEFLRNGSMNARNAFALLNDGLKRNQFGGTIGGPIVRNKLFFFGGSQVTTQRSRPTDSRAYIPTPAMLAGDFTTITSAACNSGRATAPLRNPFVNNMVDPSLFSAPALNLVRHSLFPTTSDPCGLVQYATITKIDEILTVGKIDYQRSDSHSIFGRYMEARRDIPSNFDGKNILSLSDGFNVQRVYSLVLGDTFVLGDGAVNSFRGTLNRTRIEKYPPKTLSLTSIGVKGVYESMPDFIYTQVSNAFTLTGSLPNNGHYNTTSFQFSDDISLIKGAHQLGLGASIIHVNFNGNSGVNRNLNPSFNGMFTGMGLADFLLGRVSSFGQGQATSSEPRQNIPGVYIQDTWKASPRFTVNAGVRWDPYISATNAHGNTGHFDKAAFDAGIRSGVYKNAPAGLLFPGDPGNTKKFSKNHWLHFAPRLGLAVDPTGDGRLTVRAAYGISFDVPQYFYYQGAGTGAPFGTVVRVDTPAGGYENPWQGVPGGNPFPLNVGPDVQFPLRVNYITFLENWKPLYVHQWNLSVQKQLGADWLVAGNYIGNSTIHVQGAFEANPVIYIPGASCVIAGVPYTPCSGTNNTNQRRALHLQDAVKGQYYGSVTELSDDGTSNYNGLLLSVQRRQSNGITVQGNYTWSHCIGDALVAAGASTQSGIYPGRRGAERGSCGADVRHVFNMSTVYQTPQFSNNTLRVLGSNWQISGIVRLLSGSPLSVTSGFDTALTAATGNNRANQLLADPYLPNKSVDGWLNIAAFARPANGEWGNSSKEIRGPGVITINMGLTRKFQLRENQSIEFRAEAFNMPNHMNPGSPISAINNPNFGKIQSAGDPRIMQMALKYVF